MAFTKVTLATSYIRAGWTAFNNLIDDLLSTANGLGASQIGIEDSAGNVVATNVEDAIAEIYTDVTNPRTAWDTLDEDSATTTGLTWGHKAGTVRFDNTITSVAAGTLALVDDSTNYIEVDINGTVSRNTTGFTSGEIPIREVVTASGAQTTSTDRRAWFHAIETPVPVTKGGTGLATLTDGGLLLGSGTGDVTPLAQATNGQLPIGSTGADPVLAGLTGTANQITITNGAGSITISIPSGAAVTFSNTGLQILDTNASHSLVLSPGSNLTADRTLTITTGDANRAMTLNGDLTLSGDLTVESASLVNQDLTTDAGPTFASLSIGTGELTAGSITRGSGTLSLEIGAASVVDVVSTQVVCNQPLFVNETVNANSTIGATINQGANDDEAFSVKSSDVDHGMTTYSETDTYHAVEKIVAATGGALLKGLGEGTYGIDVAGFASTADTTTTTAGVAPCIARGYLKDGTGVQALGVNDNVFVVKNATDTKFIVKGDGDIYYDGADQGAYQTHDDVKLLAELEALSTKKPSEFIDADLNSEVVQLGLAILSKRSDGGYDFFISQRKLNMLKAGALRQMEERLKALETK